MSEAEQPIVDHSHLKRETEEIEKLTKKFAKREISSNWNRYSVSENIAADTPVEEEALADFTDLLQVPPSRGGHLQLKEEADWSSASDALLNGYFALDLKVLSLGLTCVPLYKRLQLPQRIFTEEEINTFNNCAEHAKQCYKMDKIEDPSENVLHLLNKLVTQEAGPKQTQTTEISTEILVNQTEEVFNVLDIRNSKEKLLNLDMTLDDDKYSNESLTNDAKAFENMLTGVNRSSNLDNSKNNNVSVNNTQMNKNDYCSMENSETNLKLDTDCLYSAEVETSVKVLEESSVALKDTMFVAKSPVSIVTLGDENISSAKNNNSTMSNISKGKTNLFDSSESPVPKDKRHTERHFVDVNEASNQHFQSVKTISPAKEIKATVRESSAINLEDDDDLEFLLALKTPIPPQKIKEKNETAATVKDSSFLPGGATTLQSSAADTPSELDSWLDSVLED